MELREPIEEINRKLVDEYGTDMSTNKPRFRVIWSDDELEKRIVTHDDLGRQLIVPEVRERPKYKQYIRHRFILERLTPVEGETDLLEKMSYEAVWTFQDNQQKYLPPFFEGCRFIINNILYNISHKVQFAKYKDTMSQEQYIADIQKVQDDLFGNETETGDHLAYGTGVVVPGKSTSLN